MPAIMMIPASGDPASVTGSSSDIADTGPMPGSTPTSVPMNTPMKQERRFTGWSATAKALRDVGEDVHAGQPISKIPAGSWISSRRFSTHQTPSVERSASGSAVRQRTGSIPRRSTSMSGIVARRKPRTSRTVA